MATFRLWQRVRVVKAGLFTGAVGKEATIMALPGANPKYREHYMIEVDGVGAAYAMPHCLEPIQYDGNKKITWAELENLWSPERLKASAT